MPARQPWQETLPEEDEYVPAGHDAQVLMLFAPEAVENVPAPQSWQAPLSTAPDAVE